MAKVILPGGGVCEAQGITFLELLGPKANAAAVLLDGKLLDLRETIPTTGEARILSLTDPEALEVLRHTAAHILAHAVTRLFPGVKLAIGPAIADGFLLRLPLPRAHFPRGPAPHRGGDEENRGEGSPFGADLAFPG
jgi:hypothetical protein